MPTSAFDQCFELLIGHEGGYTPGKNDPGGETKFGISKRSYPSVNIKALTLDAAKAIYKRDFWDAVKGDQLPPGLALLVFDSAVNNGAATARKWLQTAAGVVADGDIGPVTLAAAAKPGVAQRFHVARATAITQMSGWEDFGKGWAIRLVTLPFEAASLGG